MFSERDDRRLSEEPIETAAANAEASRLARELGVTLSGSTKKWRLSSKIAGTTRSTTSSTSYVASTPVSQRAPSYPINSYVPPTLEDDGIKGEQPVEHAVYEFDQHGQLAPYKEGPFIMSRDQVGRVIKKRWCKCMYYLV
jgi:hypothetical protein